MGYGTSPHSKLMLRTGGLMQRYAPAVIPTSPRGGAEGLRSASFELHWNPALALLCIWGRPLVEDSSG